MSVKFSWIVDNDPDSTVPHQEWNKDSVDATRSCIYMLFNLPSEDQIPDWVNDYYIQSDENLFCKAFVTGAPEGTKVQSHFQVKVTNYSNARAKLHDDGSVKAVEKNVADDVYVVSGGFHITNGTGWVMEPGAVIVMWESQ